MPTLVEYKFFIELSMTSKAHILPRPNLSGVPTHLWTNFDENLNDC